MQRGRALTATILLVAGLAACGSHDDDQAACEREAEPYLRSIERIDGDLPLRTMRRAIESAVAARRGTNEEAVSGACIEEVISPLDVHLDELGEIQESIADCFSRPADCGPDEFSPLADRIESIEGDVAGIRDALRDLDG